MSRHPLNMRRLFVSVAASGSLLAALGGFPGQAAAQGYPPAVAASRMSLTDGLTVQLVAAEPLVRQPVCIEHDDRGRLWVIQYLQYPNPEGLTRTEVDRYSRTEYDRVPQPPPHGPVGADRITILQDTDNDGVMDAGHDFVSGLNLASGMAFGHGGVFVLNVPYLLFYPDLDRDDVPDSDPRVLLTGFGMQDAHSVANSLTWGPDGWLYGCQGSTVTSRIRDIEFQQGVWRYHVQNDQFELFCEGGGNAWGLDFNAQGDLYYSTNYGGHVLVHGVQGAYYVKSFTKHGALHNPFTYGYFPHAAHTGFRGGHVTVGGLVYQGGSLPEHWNGRYIAGDLLGHGVSAHDIHSTGSTVSTTHGPEILQANDAWFAPTDVVTGPEGALYVSDWHDARTAHPDPDADWDRSNGRIYRIAAADTPPIEPFDYSRLTTSRLLQRHTHSNQWHVRRARQELVRRQDPQAVPRLQQRLSTAADEQQATEALWSLLALQAVDDDQATELLDSRWPNVRYWALRQLGDSRNVSEQTAHRLDELAEQEPDVRVRSQLACTARRLPAAVAVPMINANINRDIDNRDPFLPLLWWWAVEQHSVSGRDEVMRRFVRSTAWQSQLGRDFLLPRLIRRYAASATTVDLTSIVTLLTSAPEESQRTALWPELLTGLQQAATINSTSLQQSGLLPLLTETFRRMPQNVDLHQLLVLCGDTAARQQVLRELQDQHTSDQRRITLLRIIDQSPGQDMAAILLQNLHFTSSSEVQQAILGSLSPLLNAALARQLLDWCLSLKDPDTKTRVRQLLLSKPESALIWLQAVNDKKIAATDVPLADVRQIALLNDTALNQLVHKHWGRLEAASSEEKLAEVRRLNNDLRAAPGVAAAGRSLFKKHCGVCHRLFGEGAAIAPDLTSANRSDRHALLVNLVDPSSVIRREYVSLVVQTIDGRVISGLPVSRTESELILADTQGRRTKVPAAQIEEVTESPVSLMPENLYRQLSPQDLRDLFAWLQSSGPAADLTSPPVPDVRGN